MTDATRAYDPSTVCTVCGARLWPFDLWEATDPQCNACFEKLPEHAYAEQAARLAAEAAVTVWRDLMGKGNDLTQPADDKKPIVKNLS